MVDRAIASFREQTYERKRLLIWDTGAPLFPRGWDIPGEDTSYHAIPAMKATIGALRNQANAKAIQLGADLIAHFDSDDWSRRRRLEEQVALLEASGRQCVGYRELLFWDTRGIWPREVTDPSAPPGPPVNEAWLYRNHQANWAAGASLLYTRELWERQPFDDAPHEDQRWMMKPAVSRECVGMSSIVRGGPRMVCEIHGSNAEAYDRAVMMRNPDVWRRAPEFDEYCERTMQ